MKIKFYALILSACLIVTSLAGCGLKMPKDSGASPSGSSPGSTAPADLGDMKTVTGIARAVEADAVTLDLVSGKDMTSSDGSETYSVGAYIYAATGESYTAAVSDATSFILGAQGYVSGTLGDLKAEDLLVVVSKGGTAVTIIDAGQAVSSGTDTDTNTDSDTNTDTDADNGTTPSPEPADASASPSPGVPDSGEALTYTVITDGLKIRSGPDTTYSVLGVLDTGSRETGTVADGWLKFTYGGKTAYCSAEFLEISKAPEGVPDSSDSKTYVTTDNLQVRSGPGTTNASLGTLKKGEEITGTVADGWLKFTYNDATAYCSAAYLSVK